MSAYLLLRDNKKSGPHSFEEMKGMGLLPHDLIWAEGRSLRWSHPSEMGEFRSFILQTGSPLQGSFAKPQAGAGARIRFPVYDLPESSDAYVPTLARHGVFIRMGQGLCTWSTGQKPEGIRMGLSLRQTRPEWLASEDCDDALYPPLPNRFGTASPGLIASRDIRRTKTSKGVRKFRKKYPHHLDLTGWLSGTKTHDGVMGPGILAEGGFHIEFSL
jgi:hypothetical protein